MTARQKHLILLPFLLLALAAVALPDRVGASPLPKVTLDGRFFPGEFPDGTLHGCKFQLGFDEFLAGQQGSVAFRVFPPTSAKQGGDTIVSETFSLAGQRVIAPYDLHRALMERFKPGSPAGWNVELAVQVTEGARSVFTGVARFLVGGDCAPAQPTTTSTSMTTSTTVPCGNCGAEPPRATLTGANGQVAGVPGSSCWSPGAGRPSQCRDSVFADPVDVLPVTRGEILSLRFATTEAPSELAVYRHGSFGTFQPVFAGQQLSLSVTNPSSLRVDFPEGTSWLVVSSRWKQGSSIALLKVVVKPVPTVQPATAKVAVIALTG